MPCAKSAQAMPSLARSKHNIGRILEGSTIWPLRHTVCKEPHTLRLR